MKSLFGVPFNWPFFILFGLIIRILFSDMGWYSYSAIMISVYQFIILFNSIGFIIPIRYLLGSFMCLQFFIGPAFAYSGLDDYQYFMYKMRIPEVDYFLYALPAVLSFIFGLHFNAGKLKGEIIENESIHNFIEKRPSLPYYFIVIGLLSSIFGGFFGSDLAFILYLLGGLKFVGLFAILLSKRKVPVLLLLIILSSVISTSLVEGMFHDLLTWIIFLSSIAAIRFSFNWKVKIIGITLFIFMAIIIQLLKGEYRGTISNNQEVAGVETFGKLVQKKNSESGFFDFKKLAEQNVRINQGFIITNIMRTVPEKVPFSNGNELYLLLEAAFLPRFLAPNKLRAGDKTLFTKYSGINLRLGTSMALGSVGDAYVNFGIAGGCLFMLSLGVLYCAVINYFQKESNKYPIIILFTPLVFYYPIRPDCDLQTILGHLVKSCFLIFLMIKMWKSYFILK